MSLIQHEPQTAKLIPEPEHIKNMTNEELVKKKVLALGLESLTSHWAYYAIRDYKISIDWVGETCVCYPFQNGDEVNEQKALLSISDENMAVAISKAVLWKLEVEGRP